MAKEKEILRLRSLGMSQKAIMSVVHCVLNRRFYRTGNRTLN